MTKFFEDEISSLDIAAAPVLKSLASTKPAGGPGRKTAEAAAATSANIAVGYSPMFRLVFRGQWQMLSFRKFFRPKPYLDAFTEGTMVLQRCWFEIVKSIARWIRTRLRSAANFAWRSGSSWRRAHDRPGTRKEDCNLVVVSDIRM